MITLIDLGNRLGEHEVSRLLEEASGSASGAQRAAARYRSREWTLLGHEEDGTVVGCVGIEVRRADSAFPAPEVVLHSVAVAPEYRQRGVGRMLVGGVAARFPAATLLAETDKDGLGFYRRCGFSVESLGEKYPGTERFRCVRRPHERAGGRRS